MNRSGRQTLLDVLLMYIVGFPSLCGEPHPLTPPAGATGYGVIEYHRLREGSQFPFERTQ